MNEIVIGREGTQPFPIKADGVSARHASLTTRDDGTLLLKDLGSKNGTYVYDEVSHRFNRIEFCIVHHETIVRLGSDDTIRSYRFAIRQIFKSDQNDYSEEFQRLRHRWREFEAERVRIERWSYICAFIPIVISVILLVGTFFLPDSMSVNARINVMRCVMMVPALLSPVVSIGGKKKLRKLNNEIKETMICPNPECRLPLSETDIKKGQCRFCKKHI